MKWLRDLALTFRMAMTRREILWTSALAAFMTGTVNLLNQVHLTAIIGSLAAWLIGVVVFLLGVVFFLVRYANGVRHQLEDPKLSLSFSELGCHVKTPVEHTLLANGHPVIQDGRLLTQRTMASSFRLAVKATSRVAPRAVNAFLTKVERQTQMETWEQSKYGEQVPLLWVGETLTVDLSDRFPRFVDVLHIGEDNKVDIWKVGTPFTLGEFFKPPGKYRLTVSLISDGITEDVALLFNWTGKWDTCSMTALRAILS
jgi:hypothetical protein